MKKKKLLAVFDCDGTIINSLDTIISTMFTACDLISLKRPSHESIKKLIGLPLIESIHYLFPNETLATHKKLLETYKKLSHSSFNSELIGDPLFPGIKKVFDELLSLGWHLGIATGRSLPGLINALNPHNLLDQFITIQTADKSCGKPNPEMLLKAMLETGVSSYNTVMIGDTTFDVKMALNADIKAIGVSWGSHCTKELINAGAELVAKKPSDITGALKNII